MLYPEGVRLVIRARKLGNRGIMLIKVNAENTTNGNPRRGWILVNNEGNFVRFFDEGYDDGGEELRELRKVEPLAFPALNITPKEYKRLKGLVG